MVVGGGTGCTARSRRYRYGINPGFGIPGTRTVELDPYYPSSPSTLTSLSHCRCRDPAGRRDESRRCGFLPSASSTCHEPGPSPRLHHRLLSLKPAPAARPPHLRSLARRAPLAYASLGISHDKGSDISDPNIVGQNDLLIVGPGVLGRIVAEKWQKEHPGCKVYGQTASKNHHSELTDLGIIPSLKGTTIHQKVPHVIFCAPPSSSDDYPGDVRLAASNWSGEGSFLFTSSTALYDCSDNSMCNEDCPAVPIGRSPRTDVLLNVENVVLEAGGSVLRLAGLYKIDRGAHVFWLRKGTLDTRPDHIINQIHYEDAASLAIAIMKKRLQSRIFLGCDNKPLSRQEIMDAVNKSGKFDTKFEGFTGTDGPLGKRMENSKTRAEIGWEPKYPSFTEFLGISS